MDRKYITDLTREEVNSSNVIKCLNKDGKLCILIKNSICKKTSYIYQTDNLMANFDNVLFLDGEEVYCHIINLKDYSTDGEQFEILYDYVFKKIENPISANELIVLLKSIEELFKISPEKDITQFQIGVYGELLTIYYFYELGYTKIVEKYHDNFYSKHDVEINDKLRFEIKTTAKEKRIHTFKHNQLVRNDVKVYVCSILLEISKEGKSLYSLFKSILNFYSNPDSILSLRKLMRKCNVSNDNQGIIVSFEKAINDLKLFNSEDLPHLPFEIPNGVSNVSYDVDCELIINIDTKKFLDELKIIE